MEVKNENFFQKLEYHFLVESSEIENARFPYRPALSEANIKTNRMGSTKWNYHKERSLASNSLFFFSEFCSSLRTSYKEVI